MIIHQLWYFTLQKIVQQECRFKFDHQKALMLITFVFHRWYHVQTVLFNDAENAAIVSAHIVKPYNIVFVTFCKLTSKYQGICLIISMY